MVRPESWTSPAGESPVRVNAGEPGSRPRSVAERRRAERGIKSLFGGSTRAGRSATRRESCSLVICTTGEPSRSCHGEGSTWPKWRPDMPLARSLRGYGERHVRMGWSGTGEARLASLVSKDRRYKPMDRRYKPMVKVCPESRDGLAGASPVRVVAKQPGSWWPAEGETRPSKRHDKTPSGW